MLLERSANLKQLETLVAEAQLGRGNVALVSGEAGIGKTVLLDNFIKSITAKSKENITVAWGGSDPLLTPRALGPLRDMEKALGAKIVKLLSKNIDTGILFDAVLEQLVDRNRTFILVFEDVHWADHASLDLLKFLGRRIAYLNVLLILSFRSDEVTKEHPLGEVLASLPVGNTTRIELKQLSLDGVRSLLKDSKTGINEHELHRITSGNPFFVTELLASKQDSLGLVPASIRAAVSTRINRLNKNEQGFLETLSMIPRAANIRLLEKLFAEKAETYVMACVGRGLLTMAGSDAFRFRHELARIGTLERVSAFEKKRLHAKILEALLQLGEPLPLAHIVHHAAGALDAQRILEFAPMAAKAASESGSHQEAASHLSTALRFIDSAEPAQAAQLYESWAYETGLTSGIDDDVVDAHRHAISLWRVLDNKIKVGENMRFLSRLLRRQGKAAEALRYLDESINVLEAADASSERAMAYSLRSQFFMVNDQMPAAIEWGEKALKLETEFTDIGVRVHALNNIGCARGFRGDQQGIEDLHESLHLSLQNNLHVDAARAYANLAESYLKYKNFKPAEETLRDGINYCTKHDLDAWIYYLVAHDANIKLQQGKYNEVKKMTEGVLKLDHLTLLMKLPSLLVLSRLYARTKHILTRKYLDKALEDARATDEVQHVIPARIALIEYAWLKKRYENVLEQLTELYELDENVYDHWMLGEILVWDKRLKSMGVGLNAQGRDLNDHYSSRDLPPAYQLELDGQLATSADAWEAAELPYDAAMVLATCMDPMQYQLLERALKLAESLGAIALLENIIDKAKALKVWDKIKHNRQAAQAPLQLHPLGFDQQELEVFKLMMTGVSDQEILLRLKCSARKLEHTIASVLKKMKVSNRIDAFLRAQKEPWLVEQ